MSFNFLDLIRHELIDTIEVFDNVYIKQGDIVNVFGDAYVGKTLFCYNIIKHNFDKTVLYIDTENSKYDLLDKLGEHIGIGYMQVNEIDNIIKIINDSIELIDYFIIDSLTATDIEKNGNKLAELFDIIKNNNSNLIIVSQQREYKDVLFYENKKHIDM